MEWKEVKFEDVIEEISMGPFGSDIKRDCYCDEGLPYLNGSNVQNFKLGEDSFIFVPFEKAEKLKKSVAHRGDVIITHRGTLGQVVYIPSDSLYPEYLISNSQFRVKFDTSKVRPDYITYYLHSREGNHKIMENASQVGVPALGRPTTTFKQIKAPIPPLGYQNRVMDILSSLDRKIETNNKINARLEEMAQAIFKDWFVDFTPFKNGKFVDCELGMIPEGWRVGTLSEIGEIVGGSTPSKAKEEYYTDKGIAWLTPKDLSIKPTCFTSHGEIDITEAGYKSTSTKLMPKGTVLFSSRAPIGYISIAKNEICTNQGFKSVVPKEAGTCFIYCFLKAATPDIENKASGSTFKEASGSLMKSLQLVIPQKQTLDSFEKKVLPLFKRIETLEDENLCLANIRDTLLPKLMSGEIEV